jgi:hypothetical protein
MDVYFALNVNNGQIRILQPLTGEDVPYYQVYDSRITLYRVKLCKPLIQTMGMKIFQTRRYAQIMKVCSNHEGRQLKLIVKSDVFSSKVSE